ncbi:ABC transporter permease [Bifidobacterium criceti]|uniref:ABC transporter permease n=2 Tax=Bifidobacterium criceti TaxID=1960969 RepID=A0A2A2EHE8_9BIFI|nr:ABC transporter permease [Bifidobacterium criceti]
MVEHTQNHSNIEDAAVVRSMRRFRWTTADIAVAAALGIAAGIIFWGFNFAYASISPILGGLLPGFASILHAVWYFSGTLAVLILRKPGAAVFVNLVGCAAEMLLGNSFSFGFIFLSAALQGLFAELPFAVTRYRVFNLPISVISGVCTALEYGVYLMLFRYQGVAFLSPRGIVHMVSEVVGGALIAGVGSWYLYRAIAKTGVLDRFASGRAVRAAVRAEGQR